LNECNSFEYVWHGAGMVQQQALAAKRLCVLFLVKSVKQAVTQRVIKARLVTIPFSHYCEKARFALDLSPLAYTEEAHAPGFHRLAMKGLSEDSNKNSVPLLILEQQSSDNTPVPPVKLQCSTKILQYLHSTYPAELGHWFPSDPDECEAALNLISNDLEKLGVHARRWAYSYLLQETATAKRVFSTGVPFVERSAMPVAFSPIKNAIAKGYNITAEKGAESLDICQKIFDMLDERLSDGRRYLLKGDKISAVDITFAALSYPLLAPKEFDAIAFSFEDYPAEMKAITEHFRQTAAGKHALRLYNEERYPDQPNGTAIHIKQEQSGGCTIM
jgi:glutathione S-transferase